MTANKPVPDSGETGLTERFKLSLCAGCRNDFYNTGNNTLGIKRCWSLAKAEIVTRFRLGWWTPPTSVKAFKKVTTLDCHHAPGRYADYKELPAHVRESAQ